ncbi:DUF4286 family protein [Musicola paradisiaca]|uniref:Uncharacterized protein n=1 Tax=Musicola paradisiaca (strain Ech703) TaxID=579405 RepID=C6C3A9_MUSP7|nr:DUF4286 family protein [Musicola paradisiaca]ACS87207.1 conserved hypothetical protein [Musicola paradisiaca Ech703]
MTTLPQGMLFVATDVDPADEADFNRWYDTEHVEERVRIEGFLSGIRYQSVSGGRKYLGLYKTVSLDCFTSASYQAAFRHQTPWSVASLGKMRRPMRRVCTIHSAIGQGNGSYLAVITLQEHVSDALIVKAEVLGHQLAIEHGFVRSCLLVPDETLSTPLPAEDTHQRQLLPMLLIESSYDSTCRSFIYAATAAFSLPLSASAQYALGWALTAEDLKS